MQERSVLVLALSILLIGFISSSFTSTGYVSINAPEHQNYKNVPSYAWDLSHFNRGPNCDLNGDDGIGDQDASVAQKYVDRALSGWQLTSRQIAVGNAFQLDDIVEGPGSYRQKNGRCQRQIF